MSSWDYGSINGGRNSISRARANSDNANNALSVANGNGTAALSVSPSETIVLCIHGNKYGVARCCDIMPPSGSTTPRDGRSTSLSETVQISDLVHCHPPDLQQGHGDAELKRARRKLIVASIVCLVFMVVEIIGGFLANSLAIATDAAHLLTDFSSFMVSLFALWIASRPATRAMSFGYHRAEVLGATISILFIWVVTGILVYLAAERLVTQDFELQPDIMLITSGLGVAINVIMGIALHQSGGHGHSHGPATTESVGLLTDRAPDDLEHQHSHHPNGSNGDANVNLNVRAAFIHVLGDLLQSISVLLASIVLYIRPDWIIIDPICTFVFSLLVLGTTLKILRDTVTVLMEGTPSNISYGVVESLLLTTPDIISVHGLRIWSLSSDKTALSAHLAISSTANPQEVLTEATNRVRSRYNIYDMTLQVEIFNPVMEDCNRCQPMVK